MMEQILTTEQKHNALIGYCFLAPLMLIARKSEYRDPFVRGHLWYASLLHMAFLVAIVTLIFSRNLDSIILYDFTWVHVVIFILFGVLLYFLGNGVFRALHGLSPQIGFSKLNLGSLKQAVWEKSVTETEKNALLLAHVPFIGIYLSAKYRVLFIEWEKFGNWLILSLVMAVMIDPSLTLFVIILIAATMWLVYQAIWKTNTSHIALLWERLWCGRDVHVMLQTSYQYLASLFREEKKLPSWSLISEEDKKIYTPLYTRLSPKVFIPFLNIVLFFKHRADVQEKKVLWQWMIISIVLIVGIILGSSILIFLSLFAAFWWWIYTSKNLDSNIPVFGEIADMIITFLAWEKKRSIPEQAHFTPKK